MIWVAIGIEGLGLMGCGVMVWLYVDLRRKAEKFLRDLDVVLNTGRGWEKRWKVCQEMFARRTLRG